MKTLAMAEIDSIVSLLQSLVGGQLQKIGAQQNTIFLGVFSHELGLRWIVIDLSPQCPLLMGPVELGQAKMPRPKPVHLFIKANLVGQKVESITRIEELGRVVQFKFSAGAELELRLLPHGQNLIVRTPEKTISWAKVKELTALPRVEFEGSSRSPREIYDQWRSKGVTKNLKKNEALTVDSAEKMWRKDVEKINKSLTKLRQDIQSRQQKPYRQVAEHLQAHPSLEVPEEWKAYVDKSLSVPQNIDQCFAKAKELVKKIARMEERVEELEEQLRRIESVDDKLAWAKSKAPSQLQKVKPKKLNETIKARQFQLPSGMEVMIGKSAQDNLKILRKARAWDTWVHLKDYPGCHGVVFHEKKQKLSEADLQKVAHSVVEVTFGRQKALARQGERFALLVAQCRHVRPIKGDKVGRVTVREEKVFNFVFEPQ